MAQVILFGGGDGGGSIISPNGVRPIGPFYGSIRLQLRGLSALVGSLRGLPAQREMTKRAIKYFFVPFFTIAVFFGVASRQAYAKPVNNCETNRCVLCIGWYSHATLEDWPAGATLATLQMICATAVSGGRPSPRIGLTSPDPSQFQKSFTRFSDNNLNIAHPWATAPEMNLGASGKAFDYLLPSLIDYGFYKDFTAEFPTSYDSKMASAVTDLQKALGLGRGNSAITNTAASGIFTIATRDHFKKFILDLLAAYRTAGKRIEKFDIVWADGRVSLFTEDLGFSIPSTAFYNIPTPSSIPTFIRKDTDRKVYEWDSVTKKWNLSIFEFPTPKSTSTPTRMLSDVGVFKTVIGIIVAAIIGVAIAEHPAEGTNVSPTR